MKKNTTWFLQANFYLEPLKYFSDNVANACEVNNKNTMSHKCHCGRSSRPEVFCKKSVSQNSQENTCARDSKNTFFYRASPVAAFPVAASIEHFRWPYQSTVTKPFAKIKEGKFRILSVKISSVKSDEMFDRRRKIITEEK